MDQKSERRVPWREIRLVLPLTCKWDRHRIVHDYADKIVLPQIGADCNKHHNDFESEHAELADGRQRQFGRWTERENNSASQPPLSRFAYTCFSRHCFISFAASG